MHLSLVRIICILALACFFWSGVIDSICQCLRPINDHCCETPNPSPGQKDACCHTEGFSKNPPDWQCNKDLGSECEKDEDCVGTTGQVKCETCKCSKGEPNPEPSSARPECMNKIRSSARIGGPDSCIVKPHSEPWIARLVFTDVGTVEFYVEEFSQQYVMAKSEHQMAQIIKGFETIANKSIKYFTAEKQAEAKKLLTIIRDNPGNKKIIQETIKKLPKTINFVSKKERIFGNVNHHCGGSLITKKHILSAAHCVCSLTEIKSIFEGNSAKCAFWKHLAVVLGDHDALEDDGEIIHRIQNTIVNENFRGKFHDHDPNLDHSVAFDLAIIILEDEVKLNDKIALIELPKPNAGCPSGKMPFVASGWGRDRPKHPGVPLALISATRFLKSVRQECLSIDECKTYTDDPSHVFCVGDPKSPTNSPCQGDSGGPLTVTMKGITTIYGVASSGAAFNTSDYCLKGYMTYARVSEPTTLKWIMFNSLI